jgi:gamma-glutamylaminecyclotransferase
MKKNSLVFVYGTLRQGEVNHYLLETARLCGPHTTQPHYKMFSLGAYPAVVRRGQDRIAGEVYRVDDLTMTRLDRLEGYPKAYARRLIPTPWGRAWIYLFRESLRGRERIPSGVWRDKRHYRRWSR